MNKVNCKRAVAGGIAAGVVLFVLMCLLDGIILREAWSAWKASVAGVSHAPAMSVCMGLWFLMSLVCGQVVVCIYASIRMHYGPGPKTALRAGFLLWLAVYLNSAIDHAALGILPTAINVSMCIGGLAASLLAALAGGAIYKD